MGSFSGIIFNTDCGTAIILPMVQFTNNEGEPKDAPLICECEFEIGHHTGCYFPSVLFTNSVWLLKHSSDSLLGHSPGASCSKGG